MHDLSPDDERDLAAAEFALGLLDGEERDAARMRYAEDNVFATLVHRWQQRFSPLYSEVAEEEVPADIWSRVTGGTRFHVARLARHAARWRFATFAASGIAAALALALVLTPQRVPAPPIAPSSIAIAPATFALLADPDGKMRVIARYDSTAGRLRLRIDELPKGSRVPELWLIAGTAAPRSLGTIAGAGEASVAIDSALRAQFAPGATLAITMEDAATAPHTAPTSAIVASGTVARL